MYSLISQSIFIAILKAYYPAKKLLKHTKINPKLN